VDIERSGPADVGPERAGSAGGLAAPAGQAGIQVLLIVADPGDMAVGAQQDARNIQCRSGVREVIDPV
jgi:hypothetical protein